MKIEIDDINDLLIVPHLYKITETLKLAISLGIFRILSDKKLRVVDIGRNLVCEEDKLLLILNVLCNIKLIHSEDGYYYNSKIAIKYLNQNRSLSHMLFYASDSNYHFKNLMDFLCHGKYEKDLVSTELYMKAMDEGNRFIAYSLCRKLKIKGEKLLLDLGCGSGIFSIIFAKYNSMLNIVCMDNEEVLNITKNNIKESGVENQINVIAGDFIAQEIVGNYDYILLSNVLHFYNTADIEELLDRLWYHLNMGGQIIILDIFGDDHSFMNILYSLEWLSNGICFTEISGICKILRKSQYGDIQVEPVKNSFSSLITARKLEGIANL